MNIYSRSLRFRINGQFIEPFQIETNFALNNVKEFYPERGNRLFGYGIFGIAEAEYPIAHNICGIFLCTYGKVIKADFLGQFPGSFGPRIFGVVEVPFFAKFLTTNKTDFARKRNPKEFEKLYGPIREEFKAWLKSIGVESQEIAATDEAKNLKESSRKLWMKFQNWMNFLGFEPKEMFLDKVGMVPSLRNPRTVQRKLFL
jgi:hypothetical protein